MATLPWKYTTDSGAIRRIYFDATKLPFTLTASGLGFTAADGTEVGLATAHKSRRRRQLHARYAGLKNTSTNRLYYLPVGTAAVLSDLANGTGYRVTYKSGEVNNE